MITVASLTSRLYDFILSTPPSVADRSAKGICASTAKGPERGDNEDRAVVAHIAGSPHGRMLAAVICDGLGGMADGAEAATLAAAAFVANLASSPITSLELSVRAAANAANAAVFNRLSGIGGTTLTALVLSESGVGHVVHFGDTRLYRSQNGIQFVQITEDHTIAAALARHNNEPSHAHDNRLVNFCGVDAAANFDSFRLQDTRFDQFLLVSDGCLPLGIQPFSRLVSSAKSEKEFSSISGQLLHGYGLPDNATLIYIDANKIDFPEIHQDGITIKSLTPAGGLELWVDISILNQKNTLLPGFPLNKRVSTSRSQQQNDNSALMPNEPQHSRKKTSANKSKQKKINKPDLLVQYLNPETESSNDD